MAFMCNAVAGRNISMAWMKSDLKYFEQTNRERTERVKECQYC